MARLARGSDFSVYFSKQSAQGAINSSPVFTPAMRSSGKPKKTISYTQDDTVNTSFNADQNIADGQSLETALETSARKQSIDFLKAAIHGTTTSYTNTATTFAATGTGITVPSATYAALSVGDVFWVTGFAATSLNTMYIISAKAGSNTFTTATAPATTESAGATVTITSNRTPNGDTTSYYTLQRRTVDTSASGSVSHFTTYDNVIDTLSLTIGETGILKCSINFKGEQEVSGVAVISGQTTAAEPTDTILSAVSSIGGFYVDSTSYTCKVKSMGINVGNGYNGDDAAGCQKYYARGAFTVGGDLAVRARIDNTLQWEAIYQAGTRQSIGVRLLHSSTEETFIMIRRALITDHNQPDNNGAVASNAMTYAGEGSSTTSTTIDVYTNW